MVKLFKMAHRFFLKTEERTFTDQDAPDWLTSKNSIRGSTMDNRWFWNEHVMTLNVGQSVETDFHVITRVE